MKLMHTKTPDFIQKMHNAAAKGGPTRTLLMRGMETVRGGKWASVKTGQIEELTGRVAQEEGVGIWASPDHVAPWEWRKRHVEK